MTAGTAGIRSESTIDTAIDTAQLRSAMGRFATGIAVVTAASPEPIGMTVNSLCSVSLEPPMLLFCVGHRSQLHRRFRDAGSFAVHVLSTAQLGVCRQFARPGLDRFGDLPWQPGRTGSPLLTDALAVFECETAQVITAGDHDIVLGRVTHLHPVRSSEPLLFFAGGFRELIDEIGQSLDVW
nr:flavin reductase family protein [Kibdelosporangium sp. MJ126-NF4]CEL19963.1 Nitrilotriacetate monooxygenase component B [Kibdelosporangium sp. MJ126-NF4]CTQ97187.1 Nitrilotriacetate monooxygenase component B (EC 1.14.13.-) [Kibdelosporangium sp. MJ126-NF4]